MTARSSPRRPSVDLDADRALTIVDDRVRAWLDDVRDHSVAPQLSKTDLDRRLAAYDWSRPGALDRVVADVVDLLERGSVHSTHPRYFGLFVPGVRHAGVVADALAALYNSQLAAWWHAPAANEIERITLDYFLGRLGFDRRSAGAWFTTGGSEANLTGVLMALASSYPDHSRDGLAGRSHRPTVYASDQAHDSFVKVARAAGLGERALRRVQSNERQQMDVDDLRRALARDRVDGCEPFMVVATAGTTATAAIDPIPALAALCHDENLWLHVDAAWGGLALLSDRLRPHLSGIERADSVTWDAHKTLPVPMGAGMFFCRSGRLGDGLFAVRTSYVPAHAPGMMDPYQSSLQWSRRFIGLKVFLTLAQLGADGLARLVEHQAAMADLLRRRLVDAGWRVVNDTPLPLVCFTRDDREPDELRALPGRLSAAGSAWISEVRVPGGVTWLRACITNCETQARDVEALIDALGNPPDLGDAVPSAARRVTARSSSARRRRPSVEPRAGQ